MCTCNSRHTAAAREGEDAVLRLIAVCAQSATALTALQQLVSSVSHNALASALPNQPPSNQQQFNGRLKLVASQYDCGAV